MPAATDPVQTVLPIGALFSSHRGAPLTLTATLSPVENQSNVPWWHRADAAFQLPIEQSPLEVMMTLEPREVVPLEVVPLASLLALALTSSFVEEIWALELCQCAQIR